LLQDYCQFLSIREIGETLEIDDDHAEDHPFVDHPDDWDHLYLSRGPGFSLVKQIRVKYVNTRKKSRSFVFVDWTAPGGEPTYRSLTGSLDIDLTADIEFNRRKAVVEAMGIGDLSEANVNAIFASLPDIVKSGAHDIGQSGLAKYTVRHIDEGGCDEFYCWHYVNTDLDDARATLDVGCSAYDPASDYCCPPGDPDCLEGRCFSCDPNGVPSPYICEESIFPDHGWKQHNRLAKIAFKHDSDGNRIEIDRIFRVDPLVGGDSYDDWEITDEEYQPKIGDMLFRYANCPDDSKKAAGASKEGDKGGASHVMMLLTDMSDPDDPGVYECPSPGTCRARIMHLSYGTVVAQERTLSSLNNKCPRDPDDPDRKFWYDFYIGEMKGHPFHPCDGLLPTIQGTAGPDILWGTPGPDVIHGHGGNDVIYGVDGDDVICGGGGDNVLIGGMGNDRVFGGPGDDEVVGRAGNDDLCGGAGSDDLFGVVGDDELYGGPGDDSLDGGVGDDWLDGGADTDWCMGDPGIDGAVNCEGIIGVP
jgi:hypothetical protein